MFQHRIRLDEIEIPSQQGSFRSAVMFRTDGLQQALQVVPERLHRLPIRVGVPTLANHGDVALHQAF